VNTETFKIEIGRSKGLPIFLLQLFLIFIAAFLIFSFQTDFSRDKNKNSPRLTINADLLEHSVLGYKNLAADMLWIRVIQEIDYAEHKFINRGWVFRFLDAVTTLDPRYQMVYREGVVVLSIIIRDAEGAAYLYERGIKNFPNDWILAYKAGYHYLHEVKNCKRAAELLNKAADNGAPWWVHALAGRLFAKSGQYELAKSVLQDAMEKAEDNLKPTFKERLDQLEAAYHDPQNKTLIEGLECDSPKK